MGDAVERKTFNRADAVALRDHLEIVIAAQRAYFESKFAAMERATCVATDRLSERLAGMNEFRDAMKDLQGRMVTRDEMDVQISKIVTQIDDLRKSRDQLEGKASQKSADTALIFGAPGTILGIVGLLSNFFGG